MMLLLVMLFGVVHSQCPPHNPAECTCDFSCGTVDGSLCSCQCCCEAGTSSEAICSGGSVGGDELCTAAGQTWPSSVPKDPPSVDNTGFATEHGRLKLDGVQLVDAAGTPVQLQGMSSHGLHWFPDCYTRESIQYLVENWGINVFRTAMYIGEGGYASDPAPYELLKDIVTWCEELGIYVLIDWHMLTPGDPNAYLQPSTPGSARHNAKRWWEEVAAMYKDKTHVLFEICNEPNGVSWSEVKTYADTVIGAIRAIDTEVIIIVGSPNWSQDFHLAAANPVAQPYHVMYTVHFYAGSHDFLIQRTKDQNGVIPIFATEWGTSLASGDGGPFLDKTVEFLDLFGNKGGDQPQTISWAQWSFADKSEVSAALQVGACAAKDWDRTSCGGSLLRSYIKANVMQGSGATSAPTTGASTSATSTSTSTTTSTSTSTSTSSTECPTRVTEGVNCESNAECCPDGEACFVKNEYWAGCLASCTPGMIDDFDSLPWSCTLLSSNPPTTTSSTGSGDTTTGTSGTTGSTTGSECVATTTCADKECGGFVDECGVVQACGDTACTSGQTCGGGGTSNVCGVGAGSCAALPSDSSRGGQSFVSSCTAAVDYTSGHECTLICSASGMAGTSIRTCLAGAYNGLAPVCVATSGASSTGVSSSGASSATGVSSSSAGTGTTTGTTTVEGVTAGASAVILGGTTTSLLLVVTLLHVL